MELQDMLNSISRIFDKNKVELAGIVSHGEHETVFNDSGCSHLSYVD